MAIDLKESGFADWIIGVDKDEESLNKALRRKIIDEVLLLGKAIQQSDIIILATPVDVMMDLLPKILNLVTTQIVLDVGSTKEILLSKIKNHPNRGNFIATHPMAGTEYSGIEAALAKLFAGKITVLIDTEDSAELTVKVATDLYNALQMKIIRQDSVSHDVHAAYVSHIAHITSFALSLTVLEKEKDENRIFELAGAGFESTVRLAKSSADMWIPIFRQNRDNVLDVLDEHINTLAQFRSLLIKKDFEGFYKKIEAANEIRRVLGK